MLCVLFFLALNIILCKLKVTKMDAKGDIIGKKKPFYNLLIKKEKKNRFCFK
jgi:hypothetical protein